MKRLFSVAAAGIVAFTLSTTAFAHSNIGETTPANGETIVEPLEEVTLNFNGDIEQGSYIDIKNADGDVIEVTTTIEEGALIGTFAEPLANDAYTVDWSIISADGHPLEGEYTFTVNAPVTEEPEVTTTTETEEVTQKQTTEQQNNASQSNEEDVTGPSLGMLIAVGVGIVALIGGVLFFVMRKE